MTARLLAVHESHIENAVQAATAVRERAVAAITGDASFQARQVAASTDSVEWGEHPRYRPYNVSRGVCVIPVEGMLIPNFEFTFYGMITGYDYIGDAVERAMADEGVRSIVLRFESFGGYVQGCFELCDQILAARGNGKPIRAVVQHNAYSAAFALASACDAIIATRSAGLGSIGVVWTHSDRSGFYASRGIVNTIVQAGEKKTDGSPLKPLSESAAADAQREVNESYEDFVASVTAGRAGRISAEAVRATEAGCFSAREAIDRGLADSIGSIKGVNEFSVDKSHDNREDQQEREQGAIKETPMTDEERAAAAAEERNRIGAITGSAEAQTRPVAARELAFSTTMTAEQAQAFLAKLPEERSAEAEATASGAQAAPSAADVAKAMMGQIAAENPSIKTETGAPATDDQKPTSADAVKSIMADYTAVTAGA